MYFPISHVIFLASTPEVKVGDSTILPQGQVKDLGVFFDKHMNLKSHISSICSSASFALRNIGKIRKHQDRATTERLVHALVLILITVTACCLVYLYIRLSDFNVYKTQQRG